MYNGIGLTTPRGSGTNGHVQRNWALVRPREKDRSYRTEDELAALDTAANKQPNKEILDHDRKRKIELKCAEFADILEEQGYSEGAITNKVNNYRNMLLNHDGKLDKAVDQWGRPSVTETHQVAEAQQEKNAKLREAFGISEYFVDGSSFDPDRQVKEQVACSNALLERERQQQLDKAQAQQYDLVQTPSPEPEVQQPDVETERKKSKKRKHKDSTSSEEALSSKKKKKSKKRNKKERSEKAKDKKAKKKRKRSSKASSDESEDTGGTSNDETTSDEERKKRKRKKKEKKKLKKKQVSSKSSSSRDSSPETRKQKPSPKAKELDKNDSKSSSSKIDYHRRDSHDEDRRRHSHSPPAHRGRDRRSRSRDKESNYRAYNSRRRSPKEKPQFSPKKTDRYKTKYELTSKNSRDQSDPPPRHTRSRSPSSEHERRTRTRKHNNGRSVDNRQHRSRSRDKRSRSMSARISKRNDSRYSPVHRSRSKSIGRRSSSVENRKKKRNRSKSSAEKILARPYSKRSRSDSVERPSMQKSRRSVSKSPEVLRLRYGVLKEGRRSISRDERIDDPYTNSTKRSARANRVSPKLQNERDRSLSLEIISRRSNTSSPRNNAYSYRPSGSQEQNKHTKLSSRHRSKSVERRQEYPRSSSMKIQQQESSPPYEKKKRSASPKQIQSKKLTAEEYNKSHSKKGSEETVLARSWHAKSASADTRNRSISIEDRLRSKDLKSDKHRYSPRDISTSPERKDSSKNQEQKKKYSMVQILSKINDDASHKAIDSIKRKSSSNRTSSRDKSSSPDGKYTSRTQSLKQKILVEEVLSKMNDDRTQRIAVTESMLSKSFKDRSRSPDSKPSKTFDYDKQKSLMEEVLSKINANKSTFRDLKQSSSQTERFNKYRTPSPDPKSVRNTEVVKQKIVIDEVVSKINDISKSAKSTTPPRSSRIIESEKHKKLPKSITKTREQKPVVCLRATSDDENSNSGNEHEENAELIENEMRVLRMLKSDLAAKAKESLERKRVSKKETPSPKKPIDPNTFDIQGPPRETAILEKVSAQLFPSYENLVKETRKGSVRDSSSKSPMKKAKDKSRSPSVESRSRSRKSSKSVERKSRSRSKTKRKSRKSVSSSSASSYSSGHRSSSSSSSSSDSSRSSRSRSRSSSGSRSSSTSSRSRSPSIPRRHGSPSFLDRRRITSARKRPIPYHRASPSTSPSSASSYSSASPWFQRNRNTAPVAVLASRSASVDSFRSPVGSPHIML